MTWAVLGIVVLALLVAAGVLVRRRSALPPARGAHARADRGVEELALVTAWRSEVEQTLTQSESARRWITTSTRQRLVDLRPHSTVALRRLAGSRDHGAAARQALAFLDLDAGEMVDQANDRIMAAELSDKRTFFDTIEKQPLTDDQAQAVLTFDNRVNVVAAAGSGKTSVMVARAAYAIATGRIPAERILMLAFNRDAADELRTRITDRLTAAGVDATGLKAATFHSFGLEVIAAATGRKPRLAGWLDSGREMEVMASIVQELRRDDAAFALNWELWRLLFARMGTSPEEGDPDTYDRGTSRTGFQTFNGDVVKSQGERLIADFLYLNGVNYLYEHPYSIDTADQQHSQYRPDFYYPDVDVWHEHWALDSNGVPPAAFTDYASTMEWKLQLHADNGTALIQTSWGQIINGTGFAQLAADLRAHGLTLNWNPDRPKPGAPPVDHMEVAKFVRAFMSHVKSNDLTPENLEQRLKATPAAVIPKYRARVFLDLYWKIHHAWNARLAAEDSIDFDDMLLSAIRHLEAGDTDPGYQLVLVDEFQDASYARSRMTHALVDQPDRFLLAVGDDFQAINRFAGADLGAMLHFHEWFGSGPTRRLQTTFRSTQAICDTATEFVQANPAQLVKTVTSAHQNDYGRPLTLLRVGSTEEIATAIRTTLETIAEENHGSTKPVTVDVLGRYRFDDGYLPRRNPPGVDVRFRTIHASKGLEADYVIVPNLQTGRFGFPSEISDDPILSLAMADSDTYPHAEERRLFYVAMTRARRHVTLITVEGKESPFVVELLANGRLEERTSEGVEPARACPECHQGLLVRRTRHRDGAPFYGCSRFPKCPGPRNGLQPAF